MSVAWYEFVNLNVCVDPKAGVTLEDKRLLCEPILKAVCSISSLKIMFLLTVKFWFLTLFEKLLFLFSILL